MKRKSIISIVLVLALVLGLVQGTITYTTTARAQSEKKIVILYTANLRGDISKLAKISAVKKRCEEDGNAVVKLVDVGNYLQGTQYASYDLGASYVRLMKQTGYDVLGIGRYDVQFGDGKLGSANHGDEISYGSLGDLVQSNEMILLSSNLTDAGKMDQYVKGCQSSYEITDGDYKAGLFLLSSEEVVDDSVLSGITVEDVDESAAEKMEELKKTEDTVIGLSNAQTDAEHVLSVTPDQGFVFGKIIIYEESGEADYDVISLDDETQDEETASLVEEYKEQVDEVYGTTVDRSEVVLNGDQNDVRSKETNLGDFWCDALRWYATSGKIADAFSEEYKQSGHTSIAVPDENVVAVWNGGNLRNYLNEGAVVDTDIYRILPFKNKVSVAYVTGAQLLEMLEASTQFIDSKDSVDPGFLSVSGIEYTINAYETYDKGEETLKDGDYTYCKAKSIKKVSIQKINGNPLKEGDYYAVITSNMYAGGKLNSGYVMLNKAQTDEYYSTDTTMAVRDAVRMYVSDETGLGGTISNQYVDTKGRITIHYDRPSEDPLPKETEATMTPSPTQTPVPVTTSAPASTPTPVPDQVSKETKKTAKNPGRVVIKSAKSKKKKKVTIKWKKVKGADGYVIYQKQTSGKKIKYKKCAVIKGGKLSYTVSKLKSGKKYKFVMRAYVQSAKRKTYSKKYSKVVSVTCK